MKEWHVNHEWEGTWKEKVVAKCKVKSRQFTGVTEEKHETPASIAGFRDEIWTWDLLNTKQEC
jgi:hypothetical protein